MSSQLKSILLVLVCSVLAVFGAALLLSRMEKREVDFSVAGEVRFATGSAKPRVTIVEFSDFQCPACREQAPLARRVVAEHFADVRLVYRQFPLTTAHEHAFEAALAAEIAGEQGKFWEMHDLLFERQNEWATAKDAKSLFSSYAEELEIDKQVFLELWEAPQYARRIEEDMKVARSLRISSTPTFFMNGKQISIRQLSQAVVAELEN